MLYMCCRCACGVGCVISLCVRRGTVCTVFAVRARSRRCGADWTVSTLAWRDGTGRRTVIDVGCRSMTHNTHIILPVLSRTCNTTHHTYVRRPRYHSVERRSRQSVAVCTTQDEQHSDRTDHRTAHSRTVSRESHTARHMAYCSIGDHGTRIKTPLHSIYTTAAVAFGLTH